MSHRLSIVLSNCPAGVAAALSQTLVKESLCACVNILDGMRSFYVWKGEVCDEQESMLLIKTTEHLLDRLKERFLELHPYEVPEWVVIEPKAVHSPYLQWAIEQTVNSHRD